MYTNVIVAIISIVIWIAISRELVKPSKETNGRKIITLMSAGSLSILIMTIPFFQNIPL
ncbi:hypothetical protein J14TS2_36130 [Bacillus sp. J14TS2]|nr:hypothetical protein J14TS2_36130 [Bacillus sp. J14TS2]